jgi:hypothetical protein
MESNRKPNRGDKILICLFEMTKGMKDKMKYEDLVVGLFKKFPNDFHMKGYPEYPDASDSTQRSLYTQKQKGHILVTNKIFSLTDSGIDYVSALLVESDTNAGGSKNSSRQSRTIDVEVDRIKRLEGFKLFFVGSETKITETDMYRYLGVTAKTSASSFHGRVQVINEAITQIRNNLNDPMFTKIVAYHDFLLAKFQKTFDYFDNAK